MKFYECVNPGIFFFKKSGKEPPKVDLSGSRTHNLVFTRLLLYHLHHQNIFIKKKQFNFLIFLFGAKFHMISKRKTFILNPSQFSFKPEKVYCHTPINCQLNRETYNSRMWNLRP
jgi:hypothetical protein